jgi:hypothetical protein
LRYASVTDLVKDVVEFLDGGAVSAYRESTFGVAARWLSRNRTLALLVLTYLVARCAIFFFAGR